VDGTQTIAASETNSFGKTGTASLTFDLVPVMTASGGTLTNTGTISGGVTIGNTGTLINVGGGTIMNPENAAIYGLGNAVPVGNSGLITGPGGNGNGVYLEAGGTVVNTVSGSIAGYYNGVYINGGAGTVVNTGVTNGLAVTTVSKGVALREGAPISTGASDYVSNSASGIITGHVGVYLYNGGTVTNAGAITGFSVNFGVGVALEAGGTVVNAASGSIGGVTGVYAYNFGTVINAGTISGSGGKAIYFHNAYDAAASRLVVNPGAVFIGVVVGNTVGATIASTLELSAGNGTLSGGLGTSFVNFGSILVDTGASWTLAGADTLTSGQTLTNAGMLILANTTFSGAGDLQNNAVIVASASSNDTLGMVTGSGTIAFGAASEVAFGAAIANGATFANTLANITAGDEIDLTGLAFAAGATAAASGSSLTVTSGSTTEHFKLANAAVAGFAIGTDGNTISPGVLVSADGLQPMVTETLADLTGVWATDGITTNPALTGTGGASLVVTLTEGAKTLGTTTANAAGVWNFTSVGLADGTQTIVARETNPFGLTGSASLTFDLQPVMTPSGGTLTNAGSIFDGETLGNTGTLVNVPGGTIANDVGAAVYGLAGAGPVNNPVTSRGPAPALASICALAVRSATQASD
jgi:hypothetical protein